MIKATLRKISGNLNAISNGTYEGYFLDSPSPSVRFRFHLNPGSLGRMEGWEWITTSMIQSVVQENNVYTLTTLNSVYELTLLD